MSNAPDVIDLQRMRLGILGLANETLASALDSRRYWRIMLNHERYEAEWEGLRLVVAARPDHWQVTVYDPAQCEVVYTAERKNIASAKVAAVDYVAVAQFGPGHDLKAEVIAEMLVWERSA